MTKAKQKKQLTDSQDQIKALNGIFSLTQREIGINRDRLALLSIHDRMEMCRQLTLIDRDPEITSKRFNTEEEEKKRIARELHDGLGQLLTSIRLHAQQCLDNSEASSELPQAIKESMLAISAMTQEAMSEVRGICGSLRPSILDDLGVLAAIKWQCRKISQAHKNLHLITDYDVHEAMIPESYKTSIYRIVQEALNNAVKYANAQRLQVKLYHAGDYLQLVVQDDGEGFDPSNVQAHNGMGMISMRERAESHGGVFELSSGKGKGVEIRVLFPVEKLALSG